MEVGGGDIGALQLNPEQNDGEQPENVNISDVLEAITLADPLYGGVEMSRPARCASVSIEEQPASKALRFRYECEGRSAGSIPGARSTAENKTYPTIRVKDYVGLCTIVVSCVTKDEPFRPHPHKLVGRDRCNRGVCTIQANITEENPLVQFKNLGIQCVKKKEIENSLRQRAEIRVDPFRTGFDPRTYPSIELNSIRLAFQVFLPDAKGDMRIPLRAVVSDVIHDKKAMGELIIVRASHCSGTARGGTQLMLLTEKVARDEVIVIFYDKSGWKAPANMIMVHKQVAIVIETPPYRDGNTTEHVNVEFRLQRGLTATEEDTSKSHPFEYIPEFSVKKRKTLTQSLINYELEKKIFQPEPAIKIEPNPSPTHVTSPPHQQMYSPVSPYMEQQWMSELGGGGNLNPFAPDNMQWQYPQQFAEATSPMHLQSLQPATMMHSPGLNPMGQSPRQVQMGQVSPNLGVQMGHGSPGLQGAMSPGLGSQMEHVSPGLQGAMSPGLGNQMGHISPGLQGAMSPGLGSQMGHVSPALQGAMSPGLGSQMGHVSPGLQGTLSPGLGVQMGHVSPGLQHAPMGHMSPSLQHQQQSYQQQMSEQQAMDTGTPSISGLLNVEPGLPQLGLNSGELFNLSSMGDHQQLSDSLTRLSTSELQQLQF